MKERLRVWVARIDALPTRQRIYGFAALAVGGGFLAYLGLFEPLIVQNEQLAQRIQAQEQEIQAIHKQVEALERGHGLDDAERQRRERLSALKRELEALEASLREREAHLVPPERIARLLREVLERNRGLQLVSLVTLPVAELSEAASGAQAPQELPQRGGAPVEASRRLYRHGVEISVRGSYLDLLRYVSELEKLPWRMYWGRAKLHVEEYPVSTLQLTVYTLSLDRAWLVI
ncbi:hypothetical protein [Pelomicrobium methylotrophicum]|uniref:MSHA biogenesis protein MshJ n=1 Tax=Pelomicrobium methylotrophicum TaxID=2602750 RepID=A0A5C7EHQ8_9PROT|nr:hypothetical protein [Pelomicrobium methylotrophicum]TXF10851.1 hypothetical protein FR698_12935 [Pelomicrobium methylotrophicum]